MLVSFPNPLLLCVIFIMVTVYSVSSQSNWSEGYYVSLNGDTIRGKVEEKKWSEQPNEFRFRPTNSKENILLNTANTKIIETDKGNYYLNTPIKFLDYSSSTDKTNTYTPSFLSQTVFLQRLVNGQYALYRFIRSDDTKLFFMGQRDSAIEYLTYYKILRNDNKISEIKVFLKQLEPLTKGCPSLVPSYFETNYNENDLKTLFTNANNCQNNYGIIKIKKKERVERFKLGISLGVSSTQLVFPKPINPPPINYQNISFEKSTNLYVGVEGIVKFHNSFFRFFSLYNELGFNGYKASGSYSISNTIESQEYRLHYLRYNLMLRLSIPIGSFSPYIQAGAASGLVVSNWNKKNILYSDNFGRSEQELPAIDVVRPLVIGFGIGGGMEWKKWGFETRLEKIPALDLTSYTNAFVVKLSYSFWTK